ncbi:hydrolase [Curtobacterium sp. MCSS17_008]|uniref:alpha/beta fold hydrolase n=1 Tax=Curtobacterium sp. MCSS17_008 TaxID=2175647 RepID=UPI000DAA8524|nr:alpha/beta fold hydrolase [Curtobacterium sp. MCSS17_008]PZF58202.1 hydrolase [Curtobacterium sp. MCSS17_008]
MRSGLPRVAASTAPATLPPPLPGLDPAWSRLVTVGGDTAGRSGGAARPDRTWHLLDTAGSLDALGVTPVGTILCVHGNPTWSYLWRSVAASTLDAARAGGPAWRVVAVDQLDMGFSERTVDQHRLADRVRDLGALTDELGLTGPVVTLGHDWGGVVSLGWAVDHPDLVVGVATCNTAVHQPDDAPIPAPLRLALRPGVLGRGTVLTPAFLETTLAIAHPRLDRATADAYRAPYRGAARRGGIGGFVADIPVDATHPSAAELDRIAAGVAALDVPALVMWGPRDPVFLERYLDDLVDRLPHADVHRFEGAGHLLPDDADVAGTVLDWLGDRLADGRPVDGGEPRLRTDTDTDTGADPDPDAHTVAHRPIWAALDDLADDDGPALVEMAAAGGPRTVTWRLLARRVREVAAGLADLGVRRGDRVSLLVTPGADLTAVLYACVRIGAVVVVADAGLGLRGLTRAVRGARPDWVVGALPGLGAARALGWPGRRIATVTLPAPARKALGVEHTLVEVARRGARRLGAGAALPVAPAPDAPAAVLFTSGSTGPAKGVVYTHGQLAAVRDVLAAQYDVGVGTGLVAGFAPFALLGPALGARSVAPDMDVTAPRSLTARAVADAVAAADATVVFLSPAALANVVATASELTEDDRGTLGRVRLFLSAGAPVSATLLAAATELMPNAAAHTPYGMTEGLLMTDIDLDGVRGAAGGADERGICVGVPASGVRVRIAPLDGTGVPSGAPTDDPGVTGEVVVAAPHVRDRYDRLWRTDRVSRLGVADPRGHRTGDVGHLDAEGRLWIEGRLQHVVTTPDGVVTPVGPEQRIERVEGVGRAGIAGTGPVGTQQVVAVVETVPAVRRPGLAPADLAAAVRAAAGVRLAAVLVVPVLPTDIRHNSKVDRARLARWASAVLGGGRMVRP